MSSTEVSGKKTKNKVGANWTTDSWPFAFQLLIFQFLLTLEIPPLQAPACVIVTTIKAPLLSRSRPHYGRGMELSATGIWAPVAVGMWQGEKVRVPMIFPKFLS